MCVWLCTAKDHLKSSFLADGASCACVESGTVDDKLHFSLPILQRQSRNRCPAGTQKCTHKDTLQQAANTRMQADLKLTGVSRPHSVSIKIFLPRFDLFLFRMQTCKNLPFVLGAFVPPSYNFLMLIVARKSHACIVMFLYHHFMKEYQNVVFSSSFKIQNMTRMWRIKSCIHLCPALVRLNCTKGNTKLLKYA